MSGLALSGPSVSSPDALNISTAAITLMGRSVVGCHDGTVNFFSPSLERSRLYGLFRRHATQRTFPLSAGCCNLFFYSTQNASPPQTKEKLRQELGYILQRHIFVESKVDLVNGIEFKPGLKN